MEVGFVNQLAVFRAGAMYQRSSGKKEQSCRTASTACTSFGTASSFVTYPRTPTFLHQLFALVHGKNQNQRVRSEVPDMARSRRQPYRSAVDVPVGITPRITVPFSSE